MCKILLPLSLSVLLVSCSAKRAQPVKEMPLPEAFSSTDGTQAIKTEWWTALQSDTIDALVAEGLANNFSIAQARERVAQARSLARQAGASRLPSLDASARHSQSWNEDSDRFESSALSLSASYEFDFWGRIGANRDAATRDWEARLEDLETAAIGVSAMIVRTSIAYAAEHEQIASLVRQAEHLQTQVRLLEDRFAHGLATSSDVQARRLQLVQVETRLPRLRANLRLHQHALAVLLGRLPGADIEMPVRLLEIAPAPVLPMPARLLEHRPDLRSAWLAVLAADERIQVAVANRFPRISLSAELSTSGTSLDSLFENWLLSLTGQIIAPLFDGGRRKAEVQRTEAVLRERLARYSEQVLVAVQEVEDALRQEQAEAAVRLHLNKQVSLQEQRNKQTESMVAQGLAPTVQLFEGKVALESLWQQRIDTLRNQWFQRIDLHRAVAGPVLTAKSEGEK